MRSLRNISEPSKEALTILRRMEARKFGYDGPDPIVSLSDQRKIDRNLAERGFIEKVLEYVFTLSLQEFCKHYSILEGSSKEAFLEELKFFMPGPKSSELLLGYFGTRSKTDLDSFLQKLLGHVKTLSEKELKKILEVISGLPETERVLLPDGQRPLYLLKRETKIVLPENNLYIPEGILDERNGRIIAILNQLKKVEVKNRILEVFFQDQSSH